MLFTRRRLLCAGIFGLLAVSIVGHTKVKADDQNGADIYKTENGEIRLIPIKEASFVLNASGVVIYNDPVDSSLFEGHPRPDLILICHEHRDHYDEATVRDVIGPDTVLVANAATIEQMPDDLKARAISLENGGTTVIGAVGIRAVAAYNTEPGYTQYHPEGRDNGYVLSIDGHHLYISGDTDVIPEMADLGGIDIAFLAVSRWTMPVDRAVTAVKTINPDFVYPYHYQSIRDRDDFVEKVRAATGLTTPVARNW